MLTFFRTQACSGCEEIEDLLRQSCLAHEVITVSTTANAPRYLPMGARPPVLVDGDTVVQGQAKILLHLEELGKFKKLWDRYQSDSCYIE